MQNNKRRTQIEREIDGRMNMMNAEEGTSKKAGKKGDFDTEERAD